MASPAGPPRDWLGEMMAPPGGTQVPRGTAPTFGTANTSPERVPNDMAQSLQSTPAPPLEEPSALSNALAYSPVGVALSGMGQLSSGLVRNPMVAFALRHTLGNVLRPFGASPETVQAKAEEWAKKWEDDQSSPGKVLHLIGEYGPDFWAGTKAMGVAQGMMTRALGWAAPKLAALGEGALPVYGGGGIDDVVKAWVGSQGTKTIAKMTETALSGIAAKPGLMRSAEVAANMGAFGVQAGARKATELESSVGDVVRDAAYGAALSGLLEGGITITGKMLLARAKEPVPMEAIKKFQDATGLRVRTGVEMGGLEGEGIAVQQVNQLQGGLSKISAARALNAELRQELERISWSSGGVAPPENMLVSLPKTGSGSVAPAYRVAAGVRTPQVTYGKLLKRADVLAQSEAKAQGLVDAYSKMMFEGITPANSYVSLEPASIVSHPNFWLQILRKFTTQAVVAPEEWIGRGGVSLSRIFDEMKNMGAQINMEGARAHVKMIRWVAELKDVVKQRGGTLEEMPIVGPPRTPPPTGGMPMGGSPPSPIPLAPALVPEAAAAVAPKVVAPVVAPTVAAATPAEGWTGPQMKGNLRIWEQSGDKTEPDVYKAIFTPADPATHGPERVLTVTSRASNEVERASKDGSPLTWVVKHGDEEIYASNTAQGAKKFTHDYIKQAEAGVTTAGEKAAEFGAGGPGLDKPWLIRKADWESQILARDRAAYLPGIEKDIAAVKAGTSSLVGKFSTYKTKKAALEDLGQMRASLLGKVESEKYSWGKLDNRGWDHKQLVKQAIEDGQTIPPEVLADHGIDLATAPAPALAAPPITASAAPITAPAPPPIPAAAAPPPPTPPPTSAWTVGGPGGGSPPRPPSAVPVGKPVVFDNRGAWMRPMGHAYEKGGVEKVRELYGDRAAAVFNDIEDTLMNLHAPIAKMGGSKAITIGELHSNGTPGGYLPHIPMPWEESKLVDSMSKQLRFHNKTMGKDEARMRAEQILKGGRSGPKRFASFDHERYVPGTLSEKIANPETPGAYMEYLEGVQEYMQQAIYRNAVGSRFGMNGELVAKYLALARAEGADTSYIKTVLDGTVGRKYQDQAWMRFARTVTSFESAMKMPFAVIQNLSQPVMNTITTDLDHSARAWWQSAKALPFREQRNALAFHAGSVDAQFQSVRRSILNESWVGNTADKANDFVLHATGFDSVEKYLNRTSGTLAARFQILDDLGRANAGQLRGINLETVRRRLGDVGIDLKSAMEMMKRAPDGTTMEELLGGAIETGAYRMMQKTQFAKDMMNQPLGWSSPFGLMMSQFKMYPLGVARLFRDGVWAEAAHGNLKPLAHFTLIAPLAGELVGGAIDSVKGKDRGRPPTGAAQYLDAQMGVGGLGLWSSAVVSAKYGRLSDLVYGPAASDAIALGQAGLQGRPDLVLKHLARQPITLAARRLYETISTTLGEVKDWAQNYGGDVVVGGGAELPATTLDALRNRETPGGR